MHGHTTMSDGLLPPSSYFSYARDLSKLDFVAITDHDRWLTDSGWDTVRTNIADYYNPGSFFTILGFEWTSQSWNHKIVWFKNNYDRATVFTNRPSNSKYPWHEASTPTTLESCLKELKNRYDVEAMVAPHHLTHGQGRNWGMGISDSLQRFVEVYSHLGSSESSDDDWRRYGKGDFDLRWGLEVPYNVGVYAAGDTHGV
jgi:hypothetical protein